MDTEINRRRFLTTAGLALAGSVLARTGLAEEQEKAKDTKDETKKDEAKPKGEDSAKEKKDAKASDDADWDDAWKSSGSDETRTCPQCGAAMYRQGRTWTCNNCGYSYVE